MTGINIVVDAEDRLLCIIGERLLGVFGDKFVLDGVPMSHHGRGEIARNARAWNRAADAGVARLVLMDMDSLAHPQNRRACPETLMRGILHNDSVSKLFLCRIAVFEAESWLYADWAGFKRFFRLSDADFLLSADELDKAKEKVKEIILRRSSGKRIPVNRRLADFAREKWNPHRAATNSKSLQRTLDRLKRFPE